MLKKEHWYLFDDRGEVHIGQYTGRQRGFECCVCGRGENAHVFNIWYSTDNFLPNYESWGYGEEHLPLIVKDLGKHNGYVYDDDISISRWRED